MNMREQGEAVRKQQERFFSSSKGKSGMQPNVTPYAGESSSSQTGMKVTLQRNIGENEEDFLDRLRRNRR